MYLSIILDGLSQSAFPGKILSPRFLFKAGLKLVQNGSAKEKVSFSKQNVLCTG
jgi:hypothetical protein